MRSVPFVDCLKIETTGQILSNAICLGDVDNDGNSELCIGNSLGFMNIYKNSELEPWRQCIGLGNIVATTIGDIFNDGQKSLVIISANGHLNVYQCKPEYEVSIHENSPGFNVNLPFDQENIGVEEDIENNYDVESENLNEKEIVVEQDTFSTTSSNGSVKDKIPIRLRPCFSQQLPPNIKKVEIIDVDDDGLNEILVTLTDRVVRTYQWRSFTVFSENGDDEKNVAEEDEPEKEPEDEQKHEQKQQKPAPLHGELESLFKWEFAAQVGGASVGLRPPDKSVLYVTQPEGSYHKIIFEEKTALKDAIETLNTLEGIMTVPDVTPEIITKIRSKNGIDKGVAFASAEGILSFIYDDQIVWSKRFEHTLTSLMKLDINQDGEDEIIVSSWDGATFIVNQSGFVNVFPFDTSISGFSCGLYTLKENEPAVPVIIYSDFNDLVHVFYKVSDFEKRQLKKFSYQIDERELSPEEISKLLYKK